jgi:stage V sporulation protein R
MMVDAGHALQFHSSPFENETEDEKRDRIYKQIRLKNQPVDSEYGDITGGITQSESNEDVALKNQRIWRKLKLRTPVEPTEDILRYIIDNSRILEDWQKDILEFLREEGRYFWAGMKTRYMNEGWATLWHEKICTDLFNEGYLNQEEHGQYNYSNALVKAMHKGQMNPYLIGSEIWKNIEERWDKGRHGSDYENCMNAEEKENWDTKDMKGREKIDSLVKSYTDWFFMQDFLTPELVNDINLYIFKFEETMSTVDVVRTRHTAKQIRDLIIRSFSHNLIPKIVVRNGNYKGRGFMYIQHMHTGVDLDVRYATETMKHIYNLWGETIFLETKLGNESVIYEVRDKIIKKPIRQEKKSAGTSASDIWSTNWDMNPGFQELIIDELD